MKTFIKITAIAVITVLAMLSCVPDVGITERDLKEVYANYNPDQIGVTTTNLVPSISGTPTVGGGDLADQKELTVNFPVGADVLLKSDSEMQAALEKFLSFHTYIDSSDPNTGSIVSSDKITTYKFVKREAAVNQTKIIISLDTVPNVLHFVAKFNESYTYGGGYKINFDTNNDSKEPIYGDHYVQVNTTGGSSSAPGAFVRFGHKGWSITVGTCYTLLTGPNQIQAVTGVVDTWFSYMTAAAIETEIKTILESWIPKFELQRWDGKAWAKDDGATFRYLDSTTTPPAPVTPGKGLYAVFTTADLVGFRIIMNGTKDLTTEKEYYGQKQKIAVAGHNMTRGYYYDKVAGRPGFYFNPTERVTQTVSPIDWTKSSVTSDSNGKNVVLDLVFKPVTVSPSPTEYWLKEISLEEFNKNVKFIYSPNYTKTYSLPITTIGQVKNAKDLVFIGVKSVTYGTSPYTLNTNVDHIKIELDPNYQYDAYTEKSVLVAPGFKYTSDKIIFGDYDNWDFEIDGVKYWEVYDIKVKF